MNAKHLIGLQGQYRDRLIKRGHVVHDGGWRSNRIVNNCHRLLASLMKGQVNMDGILFLAIGKGLPFWDEVIPETNETVIKLTDEWLRQPVLPENIEFLDQNDLPSDQPTEHLRIIVEFDGEQLLENGYQSLREFGLFGGDANTDANSGFLINYVVHPRIDITARATLKRELHLRFGITTNLQDVIDRDVIDSDEFVAGGLSLSGGRPRAAIVSERELRSEADKPIEVEITSGLLNEPLIHIDGIGKSYAATLSGVDINTIGELAASDADLEISLPKIKYMGFRAKAQLVMQSLRNLVVTEAIMDLLIKEVFNLTVAEFSESYGFDIGTTHSIYDELYKINMVLDQKYFQEKIMGDLHF